MGKFLELSGTGAVVFGAIVIGLFASWALWIFWKPILLLSLAAAGWLALTFVLGYGYKRLTGRTI
jgi:uncharacterized membrane protein